MTATLELRLHGPAGEPVDLRRTIDSHGFSDLAPLLLDDRAGTLSFTARLPRTKPRRVMIGPGRRPAAATVTVLGPKPSARTLEAARDAAAHVLRLERDLSGFYGAVREDPQLAWAATGAGRMLRSPTVWEDVVKTLCTTNCTWALTQTMVRGLVGSLGVPAVGGDGPLTHAFPTPEAMATQDESFYREVVRAGYRASSMRTLAELVASGEVDLEGLDASAGTDLPDDEVERRLLALPGIGPYAAAHVMMTLGRDSRLILDSWTRPTYSRVVGAKRVLADSTIRRRFRRYGEHAGLAFWLVVTRNWVPDER